MGHSCLAFARAGLGYIYGESEITGDNVRYAVKERVREKEQGMLKLNPAGDRPRGVVCERRDPVIKRQAKMNGMSMRDSGCRVKRSGKTWLSDGKGVE